MGAFARQEGLYIIAQTENEPYILEKVLFPLASNPNRS
jgi:hypothetical protein